ncbi:gamma-glutamyltransferase family protein [Terracoccus luteus]|uniref:Gamma-glutamyltranspeptidase/glutathione hydrolase n=1 Tax=Terracoccus luteus TaxID=53356 RepID=A0A839PRH7_9MICO|nr:gamma-glutamyltransferase family protein [Terracoccus luteus]MBB2986117.1 gamma-glutamyltranspeptidase/glutathione hydrolase [Terracoccus luteus]MCP2172293.1 gamma-glutamyltranspeptidase/glutathione hydrolase [Terracoccus luteus]
MTFTTRPTLEGTFGMVSTTHWVASQSAMRMLELGGNAFDAAVAAGFVLHVVEPHLNGPGGDLPAIVCTAEDSTPRVLCGQGPAPAGATIEHYRGEGFELVPGSGPLAAAVPGAVDAWLLMLRDHGTRALADVLEPAIGYARHGVPVLERVCTTIGLVRDLFVDDWTTSADLWLRDGQPPAPGSLVTNPRWADTLERLVAEATAVGGDRATQVEAARRAWSQGFVAEAVDAFSRQPFRDSSGERHAGLVTGDDMAAFSATWEDTVSVPWQGHEIAKTAAWGQGPALLQTLRGLDALGDPAQLDPAGVDGIHAITETMKLAYADREAWYGDVEVPLDTLLSEQYARERAALVGERASLEVRPGSPDGREPRIAAYLRAGGGADRPVADATLGEPTVDRRGETRGDTCHVDVVDRWGNMVSATPSGGWLQSSPTVPELGFCLGSRMQMFWLEEGLASSLAPGRRPRTTLTPTMVLRDGAPVMACGSPGGDQQDQWQLLFLLRTLVHGQSIQEAIDAPSWHTNAFPGSFWPRAVEPGVLVVEDRIGDDVVHGLRRRGHEVRLGDPWSEGRLCAVTRDPDSGVLRAGANPRGMQGYAVGR